ncbi:MAG: MotA/TolQ/ExbB proton channel family protein [Phycisphaerae bacterium]
MAARYSMVKMRSFLMAGAAALVLAGLSQVALAQGAPAPSGGAGGGGVMQILFHGLDYLVIVILVCASIAGVALAIDAALHIREIKIIPEETTEHLRSLINSRQFKELLEFTSTDQTFVSQSLNAGLRRAHLGYPAMREALESSSGEQTANMFRRIEMLNVIGNIGPLIGLLGTVLGMIIAFYAMQDKGGDPKPGDLAGGIATALWHTFGGLFVAIPCLVVFGLYRTKTDKVTTKATILAEELLESLRPGEKGSAPSISDDSRAPAAKPRRVAAPQPEAAAE